MNQILRHALLSARLDEIDVAAYLDVDPKTVRRWLEGRLPYARYRWALADLLKLDEADLWPQLRFRSSNPDEIMAIYPHRSLVPREIWRGLFKSAEYEISFITDIEFFLTEDLVTARILMEKAKKGVQVRIALDGKDSIVGDQTAFKDKKGKVVAIGSSRTATPFHSLCSTNGIEIRQCSTKSYSLIYRADEELLVNQRVYGFSSVQGTVLHLKGCSAGGIAAAYVSSFERIWSEATPCSRL